MKVRLKENINIKDLAEDNWNGCKSSTLDFIELAYKPQGKQEVFEAGQRSWSENYFIEAFDNEYIINRRALEIIEDKEIEEIPFNNGMKEFIDVYHELERYNYKINEIIIVVNELKKGK